MKLMWIYWWWVTPPTNWVNHGPFIKATYSSRARPVPGKHLTEYDRENGCRTGRVHRQRVLMEEPPRMKKKTGIPVNRYC